jgi:hypothetical protein
MKAQGKHQPGAQNREATPRRTTQAIPRKALIAAWQPQGSASRIGVTQSSLSKQTLDCVAVIKALRA